MSNWLTRSELDTIPPEYLDELLKFDSPQKAAENSSHMVALLWLLQARCQTPEKHDLLNEVLVYAENLEHMAAQADGPENEDAAYAAWEAVNALRAGIEGTMPGVLSAADSAMCALTEENRQACQELMDEWLDSGGRERVKALLGAE